MNGRNTLSRKEGNIEAAAGMSVSECHRDCSTCMC